MGKCGYGKLTEVLPQERPARNDHPLAARFLALQRACMRLREVPYIHPAVPHGKLRWVCHGGGESEDGAVPVAGREVQCRRREDGLNRRAEYLEAN